MAAAAVDRRLVRILILFLAGVLVASAQSMSARIAQRASVERQRAAVFRQRVEVQPEAVRREDLRPVSVVRAAPPAVVRPACATIQAPELVRMIDFAAKVNHVPSDVVREVARQESAFQPCAVSSKGAEGLMQLMPATQASLGVEDPFDPEESLMAGARLLRELLSRYNGSLPLALSAYNAGPSRVDRADGIPAIAETRNYVAQILGRLTD